MVLEETFENTKKYKFLKITNFKLVAIIKAKRERKGERQGSSYSDLNGQIKFGGTIRAITLLFA